MDRVLAIRTAIAIAYIACYAALVTAAAFTDPRLVVATLAGIVLYELRGVLR